MRYGMMLDDQHGLDSMVEQAKRANDLGFHTVWSSQIFGVDALTAFAVIGREVPRIELGTAVVPTSPRHPMMLAGQALPTQAACGGRLVLGIGLSHQVVIENMFGYSFEKPARHMREYLSILGPLVREGSVNFQGETLKAMTMQPVKVAGATPFPILLAALAPQMLKLAGSMADGTVTWMTGPATIADHIVPSITAASEGAGRPAPRVAVGLPVCVTADVDKAREQAATTFAIYGQLPSYRAMLDIEGAADAAGVAIVGDEAAVRDQIDAVAAAGATDFVAAEYAGGDERERTRALLKSLV